MKKETADEIDRLRKRIASCHNLVELDYEIQHTTEEIRRSLNRWMTAMARAAKVCKVIPNKKGVTK